MGKGDSSKAMVLKVLFLAVSEDHDERGRVCPSELL